ncbi:MAG: hypothetical protein Q7Q71_13265 [Verrucomicrobiota bacterium JB023]|nr:hypothetical protein [Verrucomicrobiota bacterium JB023]
MKYIMLSFLLSGCALAGEVEKILFKEAGERGYGKLVFCSSFDDKIMLCDCLLEDPFSEKTKRIYIVFKAPNGLRALDVTTEIGQLLFVSGVGKENLDVGLQRKRSKKFEMNIIVAIGSGPWEGQWIFSAVESDQRLEVSLGG